MLSELARISGTYGVCVCVDVCVCVSTCVCVCVVSCVCVRVRSFGFTFYELRHSHGSPDMLVRWIF